MEAPPRSYIGGIPPNTAYPPINEPNAIPPAVEGPGVRDMPPEGRQSYNVLTNSTTPVLVAPRRSWRQGCLLLNEDGTNSIRYGETTQISATVGALLPANEAIILRGAPEIYAIAVAGGAAGPRVTVCDEWFSAPPQRQPMGM